MLNIVRNVPLIDLTSIAIVDRQLNYFFHVAKTVCKNFSHLYIIYLKNKSTKLFLHPTLNRTKLNQTGASANVNLASYVAFGTMPSSMLGGLQAMLIQDLHN